MATRTPHPLMDSWMTKPCTCMACASPGAWRACWHLVCRHAARAACMRRCQHARHAPGKCASAASAQASSTGRRTLAFSGRADDRNTGGAAAQILKTTVLLTKNESVLCGQQVLHRPTSRTHKGLPAAQADSANRRTGSQWQRRYTCVGRSAAVCIKPRCCVVQSNGRHGGFHPRCKFCVQN